MIDLRLIDVYNKLRTVYLEMQELGLPEDEPDTDRSDGAIAHYYMYNAGLHIKTALEIIEDY